MRIAGTELVAILLITAPLGAQLRVETGGGGARLDQMPSAALTALGGSFDGAFGRTSVQFAGSSENHIGLGVVSAFSGGFRVRFTPGSWRIEAGPASAVARGIGESWGTTLAADLRVERDLGPATIRGGWQQGVAWTGSQSTGWYRPAISADYRVGAVRLSGSWQNTVVQGSLVRSGVLFPAPLADSRTDTLSVSRVRDIQDVVVRMAWAGKPLDLDAKLGRRFGVGLLPQTWWEAHGAWHLTPVLSLTARTGHLASDVLLGVRGGSYNTVGLRLDLLQHAAPREPISILRGATQIVRESEATVHLYFTMPPRTRQVSISSDLTGWLPVNLSRNDDGRWEIVLAAKAGVHRLNVRADGGPWFVPTGLPTSDDGFGAKVGLLVLDP